VASTVSRRIFIYIRGTICWTSVLTLHVGGLCVCLTVSVSVCLAGALRSPAAPTVTVLSDTSVMVRWMAVPTRHLGGLNVLFYKVQYRRVGGRRKSRGWETVDEDIPSTKHAIRINRLRPGHRQR